MEETEPPRRRRRPALSCLACRRRKLKCDRESPCARCVLRKIRCTYRVHENEAAAIPAYTVVQDSEAPATPSPTVSLLDQASIGHNNLLDTEHGRYPSAPSVEGTALVPPQPDRPGESWRDETVNRAGSGEAISDLLNLRQRIQKLEDLSTTSSVHGLAETGRHILARRAGLRDSEVTVKKTRLLRWSDWMGTAPEFQFVYKCFEVACGAREGTSVQTAETKAIILEIDDLYAKCKRIAKTLKADRPSRCLSSPRPNLEPPPRDMADTMATAYFQCFEPAHRILHEPSFWAEYQQFWENPQIQATGNRLKVLLVIGIGSSICDEAGPDGELRRKAQQWVYTAQAWLSGPLEKDRLDIEGLQIHCLTMLARQIFSIGGDLVWMSMGSLVHRAMQIGLHRDPVHLPNISILQAEIRRRLWYTIVELLIQSSLDSAMPPRISLEDFDTKHPSNNHDDEIDESTTVLVPHPKEVYTSTSIQLLLIESLPTRLRAVQLLNGLHSELAYLDILSLSADIMRACQACDRFTTENRRVGGATTFQRNMCDFLIRRFLIPLHCPFASEAHANPLYEHSQKVALDTALALLSPEADDVGPDRGRFARLMAVGGGMYREGFRYATSAVALALLERAQAQREDGTFRSSTGQLDFLRRVVDDEVGALTWERIRQGETNIKGPVFLSIVLAVADSPRTDDTVCEDPAMARKARDSLALCHQILETRAKAAPPASVLLSPTSNGEGLGFPNDGSYQDALGFGLGTFDFFFPNTTGW